MTWLRLDASAPDHPKVRRVAMRLRIPAEHALGLVVTVWCRVSMARPDGSLIGLTVEDIDGWAAHEGVGAAMIAARMIDVGDDGAPIAVHNWSRYAEGWKAAQRTAEWRKTRTRDVTKLKSDVTVTSQSRHGDTESRHGDEKLRHGDSDQTDQTDQTDRPTHHAPDSGGRQADPSSPPTALVLAIETDDRAILRYPCDGDPASWALTESQARRWSELYPSLDVEAQCRAALAWVEADSARRKTARGMCRFLASWLARAQDRGGGRPAYQSEREQRLAEADAVLAYERRLRGGR